ncbi:X-box-binding protein 1 [Eumeta japonica]|uniref:X-box-binding protein 1 n=1 Tax=Eumeta variegata TaxID=151549 RepID=A0A4C1UJ51_EUMVA|nr:X-box-binding protein 1 [Eumeta japonica]
MSAPIIITLPNNYLVDSGDTVGDVPPTPTRKRRLDHLTWEEKMQRKKLKNRVAAQTSRDRKKAKMDDMERRIEQLEEAKERLSEEVASLRALNERLVNENAVLRSNAAAARDVTAGPTGPAESPQQKDGSPAALRAARLLLTMCLLSRTCSPTSIPTSVSTLCSNLPIHSSKKLVQLLQERLQM